MTTPIPTIAELNFLIKQGEIAKELLDAIQELDKLNKPNNDSFAFHNPEDNTMPESPWRFLIKGELLQGDERFGYDKMHVTALQNRLPECSVTYYTQRSLDEAIFKKQK